ncbi:protein NRT1/ PTR FAMILY 1.2-like [Apium graveolens]|uniref:protein NRT1/ PTR FAMILY 1.2-like n=1 Tax=Apium graveolens TaxID=4045 RepID=UPI003D7B3407
MEMSTDHKIKYQLQQEEPLQRRKGGLFTMPFIIANEAFEKVASYGLLPNMIVYLMKDYGMSFTQAQNVIFFWTAATNFMPIFGALFSDSYLGRFLTIGLGSIFSFLGMFLLWLTAMIPEARPDPCDPRIQACKSASPSQYFLLISSFALISIGAGGIRPCSLAFGADQIDNRENSNNLRVLERYFGWYYASAALSVVIALTGIVYIQVHVGWKVGFGVPAILMFLSTCLFFIASSFYVKHKIRTCLLTSFIQVLVVACRNWDIDISSTDSEVWYHLKESTYHVPTNKFRFLNKACIIRNPEEVGSDGIALNPWTLCSVDQVEELKVLIRVIPLWSAGIMMSINISQSAFPYFQAQSMDRHLTSNFEVPAGSFGLFTIIALFVWVMIYDRIVLPVASKIRGEPVHIGMKHRMGIGLFLSFLGTVASAAVEHFRRSKAIQQGYLNNPSAVVDMSAYWLVPQYVLNGLAEAFNAIGQTEFYYSQFPKSMSSIASSLVGVGMAFANLLASLILSTVDHATKSGGKESWTSSNINKAQYDSYYWLLAILSAMNIVYFMFCS